MIYNLGSSWSYTIVCGNKNYKLIESICNSITNNIKIINTNYDNLTQNQYNNFLYTKYFWDLFVGEKIFICQEDTCIFRNDIDKYMEFDYVGGAFCLDCVSPVNVGNGGFSLRSKTIMKEIIDKMPAKKFVTKCSFSNHYRRATKLDLIAEDNYFPQVMQDLNIGKLAPHDLCQLFSSEQIFTENSLGMHCLWFCNKEWEKYIIEYFDSIFKKNNILDSNKTNSNKTNIDVYILHCDDFTDREIKIKKAKEELEKQYNGYNINVFKGINTSKINLDYENQMKILQEYDPNLSFDNKEKYIFCKGGQLGCYLGHHLIIKHIAENINKNNYSIILEDDIMIKNNFTDLVIETIEYFESKEEESFDMIYIGYLNNNKGTKKTNNIYNINKANWIFGTHGLLINNKRAAKLYKLNCNILNEMDVHYKLLYNNDLIQSYYLNDQVVVQDRTIFSYIDLKKNNC
jgi:GR25 family glycosyltransferase involved in LPS biosynthesis